MISNALMVNGAVRNQILICIKLSKPYVLWITFVTLLPALRLLFDLLPLLCRELDSLSVT